MNTRMLVSFVFVLLLASSMRSCSPSPAQADTATFYTGSSNKLADGTRYGANGWGFCAASSRFPLGTLLQVHCPKSRRTCVLQVRDRGAFGRDVVDLPSRGFERLVGPNWRILGRVRVEVRVLRHSKEKR